MANVGELSAEDTRSVKTSKGKKAITKISGGKPRNPKQNKMAAADENVNT
jgi:hypothetical protein